MKRRVNDLRAAIVEVIGSETAMALPAAITAIVDAVRLRHGETVAAVLAYGSCLRDGESEALIVDLYVLVDDYRAAGQSAWFSRLNAWLPPNVYYLETAFDGRKVRGKYAVVTLQQFERLVSPAAFHSYFWGRFAQPTAIAWARHDDVRRRTEAALAAALMTLAREVLPTLPVTADARTFWVEAFRATYSCELRAERGDRPALLFDRWPTRYELLHRLVADATAEGTLPAAGTRNRWAARQALGKGLSVVRLIKAAFTFHDGADYIAWKISRHSCVPITLTPWQRRHPILAGIQLFWHLYRSGAFR